MESLILGVFSEQLSKLIIGFRKEQVNANLLTGKGEITDVDINVDLINDLLRKKAPSIEFQSIHVTKVSFNVTSVTNLKKAPIVISVDEVHVTIVEPLDYHPLPPPPSTDEEAPPPPPKKDPLRIGSGQYGLFDRIGDNLTLEINRVYVSYQTWGKFKTRRRGVWTPPSLAFSIHNLKYVSVDEFGEEGTPDEVWRHNKPNYVKAATKVAPPDHRILDVDDPTSAHSKKHTLLIYKKLSMLCNVTIQDRAPDAPPSPTATITTTTSFGRTVSTTRPATARERAQLPQQQSSNTDHRHYLVRNAAVEIHLALQKRKKDAELLGIQVDVALTSMEVDLDQSTIPLLAHSVAGIEHALAKDRAFDNDPLLSRRDAASRGNLDKKQNQPELEEIEVDMEDVPSLDEKLLADADRIFREEEGDDEDDYDDDDEEDDDDEDEAETGADQNGEAVAQETVEVDAQGSIEVAPSLSDEEQVPQRPQPPKKKKKKRSTTKSLQAFVKEKACFTLSIQNCVVRATYHSSVGGYMQMNLKGLVAEVVWPKNGENENGGYLQLSLSYINLQERHGDSTRPILIGGGKKTTRLQDYKNPPDSEPSDEFPKFERRSLRDDLGAIRSLFPAQAIGLKSTVTFGKVTELNTEADIHVDNEIGIDQMEFIVDAEPWTRFLHFCLNTEDGGFDPRWHSGMWSDNITSEMLVSPTEFDIDKHLQPLPDLIHAENSMITSDMITVTTRARRLSLRLPAPVHEDIRSADILVSVGEAAVVVSSELPRSFLSGRISGGTGEDATHGDQFPNDPSDVSFSFGRREQAMEKSEMESRVRSTFRIQADITDCGVQVRPAVPLCSSQVAMTLLAPTNISIMVSFEGEAPASLDPVEARLGLYLSILLHSAEINVDLDMICSAAATVLYQVDVGSVTLSALRKGKKPAKKKVVPPEPSSPTIVQMNRIRKTGTLGVVACVHIPDLDLRLWRQNVPLQNRANSILRRETNLATAAPLVLLCRLGVKTCELEVDFSTGFRPNVTPCAVGDLDHLRQRRIVAKASTSEVQVLLCDFDAVCCAMKRRQETKGDDKDSGAPTNGGEGEDKDSGAPTNGGEAEAEAALERVTELLCLGGFKGNELPGVEETDEKEDRVSIRVEYRGIIPRVLAISADVGAAGTVATSLDVLETFVALMVESLLKPVGECCKNYVLNARQLRDVGQPEPQLFLVGTVGAFLHAILREAYYYLFATIPDEPEEEDAEESVLNGFGAALVRCRLRNMLVLIAESQENSLSPYGLLLEQTSFGAGFFNSAMEKWKVDLVVSTRSGPDLFWQAVFDGMDSGFHLGVSSRQSLYKAAVSTAESQGAEKKGPVLMVPTFGAHAVYSPTRVDGNLDHLSLCCAEISAWTGLFAAFEVCATQGAAMVGRAPIALFVPSFENDGEFPPGPVDNASEICSQSVKSAWNTLTRIKTCVDKHDNELRSLLTRKQGDVGLLATRLFLKERQRVAAMALLSSHASGWVRFGSTQSPLRVLSNATLWKRWAVLRRSLLVISESSSTASPIDIISLEGAKLFSLEGQLQKSDSNRGFVVVDRDGNQRVFVVATAGEYEMWIGKLSLAIGGNMPASTAPSAEVVGNGPNVVPNDALEDQEATTTSEGLPLPGQDKQDASGEATENASVAEDGNANQDGQLSGDGELQPTLSTQDDNNMVQMVSDDDQSSVRSERRRDQLRQKVSAIGSSTKLRFGAAMQSARNTVNAAVDSGKALQGKLEEDSSEGLEANDDRASALEQGPQESVAVSNDAKDSKTVESSFPDSSAAVPVVSSDNEPRDVQDATSADPSQSASPSEIEPNPSEIKPSPSETEQSPNEVKQSPNEVEPSPSETEPSPSEIKPKPNPDGVFNSPLRQKMSVVGSSTKKGFGAAMLSARKTMNSAVESSKKLPGIVQDRAERSDVARDAGIATTVSSEGTSGNAPANEGTPNDSTSVASSKTAENPPSVGVTPVSPSFPQTSPQGSKEGVPSVVKLQSPEQLSEAQANFGQKTQVQLRQKMSVLGASTKNRFGAAMLSARNTVNAAVDKVGPGTQPSPGTSAPATNTPEGEAQSNGSNDPEDKKEAMVATQPAVDGGEVGSSKADDGVPPQSNADTQGMAQVDDDDQSTSKGSITPLQVRQKMSVLGSTTKTRFGAAMMSARNKMNAAVESRKQPEPQDLGATGEARQDPAKSVEQQETQPLSTQQGLADVSQGEEVPGLPQSQEAGTGGEGVDGLRDGDEMVVRDASVRSTEGAGGSDGDDQSTSKGSITPFQVRQKFSVLGSTTKTRFGAAMQSARSKVTAAVDAAVDNQTKSRAVRAAEREVAEDRVGDSTLSELSSDVSAQDIGVAATNTTNEMQPVSENTAAEGGQSGRLDNPDADQLIKEDTEEEKADSLSLLGLAEPGTDEARDNTEGLVIASVDKESNGTGRNQLVAGTTMDAAIYRSTEAGLKSVAKLRAGGVAVAKLGVGGVAKLGAAVKTVKLVDSETLKAPTKALSSMSERVAPSTSGASKAARSLFTNTIKSAGSVGRGFTRDTNVAAIETHAKPWKLKAIRAGVEPPDLKKDAESRNPNESFFAVGGTWSIKVVPRASVYIDEDVAAAEDPSGEEKALRLSYGIRIKCMSKGVEDFKSEKEETDGSDTTAQGDEGRELYKTLPDMLLFHSALSEALGEQDTDEIVVDGSTEEAKISISSPTRSALELVGSLGMKLDALLQALNSPESLPTSLHLYSCEAFEKFLRAVVKCPIPMEATRVAQRFLELDDADWTEVVAGPSLTSIGKPEIVSQTPFSDESPSSSYAKEVVTLAAQCESELAIAQSSGYLASQLARSFNVGHGGKVEGVTKVMSPPSLLPTSAKSSDTLHSSLQEALVAAMAERDEAQAQLVAANVLHVHEVEQQRKRAETLEMRLAVAEQLADEGTAPHAAFFLGQDEVPQMNSLKKHEKEMMQNTDEELSGLCQQLSNEIASRTSGDLELLRIKESRKVELEKEAAQRRQLESELDACKERLRQAEEKWEDAAADAMKWRKAFEEAAGVEKMARENV